MCNVHANTAVASFFCDIIEDTLTFAYPSSSRRDRGLALGKLVAVSGFASSAFITVNLVNNILSSTLLLTSVKVGIVAFIVIASHDIYVTAKKKQTSVYAPAYGGSLKGFLESAFSDTWLKPLWVAIAMNCIEVYERLVR